MKKLIEQIILSLPCIRIRLGQNDMHDQIPNMMCKQAVCMCHNYNMLSKLYYAGWDPLQSQHSLLVQALSGAYLVVPVEQSKAETDVHTGSSGPLSVVPTELVQAIPLLLRLLHIWTKR